MKKLFTLFAAAALAVSAWAGDFTLKSPFTVDDFEEGPSNLVVNVFSSNTNLVSNSQIFISGEGLYRLLSVTALNGKYGDTDISVDICDNGLVAERGMEFHAAPGTPATNSSGVDFPLFTTVTTTLDPVVNLSWTEITNRMTNTPFIIHRSEIPLTNSPYSPPTVVYKTIGQTNGTNFIDTNVVNGTDYYYIVTWTGAWMTNLQAVVQCTNMTFTFRVRPEVPLVFMGDGFGFHGKAGKTYRLMTNTNLSNNPIWQKILDVTSSEDHLFIFRGQEYLGKPIHVRELD